MIILETTARYLAAPRQAKRAAVDLLEVPG